MNTSEWFRLNFLSKKIGFLVPVAFSRMATKTFLIPDEVSKVCGERTSKRTWNALIKLKEQIQKFPHDVDWRIRYYLRERDNDSRLANLIAFRDKDPDGSSIIRVVMLNEY